MGGSVTQRDSIHHQAPITTATGDSAASWHVRPACEDDEESFIRFLGHHISDRNVEKHFKWLYLGNPHGRALTWIAVKNGTDQIVGCTSTFPRIMNIAGADLLASKGGDAYVDPEFRRQGIAQALHAFSVGDMQNLGIACNFGIAPAPANFRAFMRVGALSPGNFDTYRLPLDASWVVDKFRLEWIRRTAKRLLDPVVRFYVERQGFRRERFRESLRIVDRFDSRVNELFASVSHKFGVCGKRDSEYLNWRFAEHPFKQYTLVECSSRDDLFGYAVLGMVADRCKILDFLCRDDEIGLQLFLKLLSGFARDRGCRSLFLYLNPAGPYVAGFERCGFLRAGRELPMMILTNGSPDKDEIFNDKERWYLMPGDDDST